ncbi:MAG: lytic transglycosylase domain-containing protein, partial [Spirochaetaceae bacterium]
DAYNRYSGAAGLWQLLPATARHYGIRVDRGLDQRFEPEASTKAASLYLKDLISIVGKESMLLVLAAYNAGDATIVFALKQIPDPVKDRNFWYLYKNNLIPEETRQYVLRILALILCYSSTI